jgi:gag-polypeptide of LTR copia-type
MTMASITSKLASFTPLSDTDYEEWSNNCRVALGLLDLRQFIDDTCIAPPVTKPDDHAEWAQYDRIACECIWSRVTYLQRQRIENHSTESTAHALWLSIRCLHRHAGVLGQVNHLRKAFGMRFTKGQAIEPVIDSMIAVINRVFELGTPTREDMIVIVVLQGLSPDFEVLHEVIEASGDFNLLSLRLHL